MKAWPVIVLVAVLLFAAVMINARDTDPPIPPDAPWWYHAIYVHSRHCHCHNCRCWPCWCRHHHADKVEPEAIPSSD